MSMMPTFLETLGEGANTLFPVYVLPVYVKFKVFDTSQDTEYRLARQKLSIR